MTDEEVQAFSLRVTQANQSELTVITYEIVLKYIADAISSLSENDIDSYVIYNTKAREFLRELMAALTYTDEVSYNLIKIYSYVHGLLVKAGYDKDKSKLETASGMLNTLLVAFRKVAENDTSSPVMMNTQQVYAGLTYGKGYLNETTLDNNITGRGFQA